MLTSRRMRSLGRRTPAAIVVRHRCSRPTPQARGVLRVQALFGRSAPSFSGGQSSEQVAELVSVAKRYGNPSEAANEAIAEFVPTLSKLGKKNPRTAAFIGKWNILYSSGQSGLTALPGRIASFTVSSEGYENECTTRTLGVFGGYAKEGGRLKVSGGDTFELLQEYLEFKNGPGAVSEEESVDAPIRTFQVIYLDDDVLFLRLKSTRLIDENGRMQNVVPDDDYFLVWQKAGASVARPTRSFAPDVVDDDDEDEEEADRPAFPPLFGFGTAILTKKQGLATIAERSAGGQAEPVEDRRAAQREAAEAKRQEAEERKRAQAEAAAERKRAQAEAAAERKRKQQEAAEARAAGRRSQKEEAPKSGGLLGLFGKREEEGEEEEEAPPQWGGFGLFGKKAAEPEEPAPKKAGGFGLFGKQASAAQEDPAARRRADAEDRRRAQEQAAEDRRREAEERKAAAERAREEAAAAKAQQAAMREQINEAVASFQADVRECAQNVKDITDQLRTAQREGRESIKAGEKARRQLEQSEAAYESAESDLENANSVYNQLVEQLREKAAELKAAEKEVADAEKALLK